MAGFIMKAKAQGLDHWLAGIHLVEHGNTNMAQVLPFMIEIAMRVNSLTGGWLQQPGHGFLANGGGWGADYKGINSVQCPVDGTHRFACTPGSALPFFQLMAQQTGWFAFGYKFMEFKKVHYYGRAEHNMGGLMQAYCRQFNACDPKHLGSADWERFLSDDVNGLGFSELAAFVGRAAAQYPHHANVIFVGDNSDSIATMDDAGKASCAAAEPLCAVQAVSHLFNQAAAGGGGWDGRLFINGIEDASTETIAPGNSSDDGRTLTYIPYDPLSLQGSMAVITNRQTLNLWQSWPRLSADYNFLPQDRRSGHHRSR